MPNKSITFMLSLMKSHLNGDATNLVMRMEICLRITNVPDTVLDGEPGDEDGLCNGKVSVLVCLIRLGVCHLGFFMSSIALHFFANISRFIKFYTIDQYLYFKSQGQSPVGVSNI